MKYLSKWTLTVAASFLPLFGMAHEGHGHFSGTDVRHYWASPEHFVPIFALSLVFIALLIHLVQLNKKKAAEKVNSK